MALQYRWSAEGETLKWHLYSWDAVYSISLFFSASLAHSLSPSHSPPPQPPPPPSHIQCLLCHVLRVGAETNRYSQCRHVPAAPQQQGAETRGCLSVSDVKKTKI